MRQLRVSCPRPLGCAVLLTLTLATTWGCATSSVTDASTGFSPLTPDVLAWLKDPAGDFEDVPSSARATAADTFATLTRGDLQTAEHMLAVSSTVAGELRQVLDAQIAFADGRREDARRALPSQPLSPAGQLLSARLYDLAGRPVEAVRGYSAQAGTSRSIDERLEALLPAAVAERADDLDAALTAGDIELAALVLTDLEAWAPESADTRRSAIRVARASGDRESEVASWRRLARVVPPSREEMFAWAELELAAGSADQALEISRALVSADGSDARARDLLARAEFTWRAGLLPASAREVLASPALSRGELAVALYWLFPQARYAETQEVRIASDILESPHRDEIVQIVNAGLLDVDLAGHRFRPDQPAGRRTAVGAVVEILRRSRAVCVVSSASNACTTLSTCGVVDPAVCGVGSTVSGPEFSDWARRAQEVLAGP